MLDLLLVLLIVCCLVLAAFFEGSETALISANRIRLRTMSEQGDHRARRAVQLLDKPSRLLVVMLVGENLLEVAATTLATVLIGLLFSHFSEDEHTNLKDVVTTIIMTLLMLIFVQIIPKAIGRTRANSFSRFISTPMSWASILFYPLAYPIGKVGNYIALLFGDSGQDDSTAMEELRILAKLGERHGAIRPQQSKMISSVFDLREQTVGRVMVPLVDIVSVEKNTSVKEFYDKVSKEKFSRFPVYSDKTDNIIGIVNVLDVLYSDEHPVTIREFIHEDVVYLPESKRITSSLQEIQKNNHPMGIVVDEYGGVVGIVTLEDIVAEIVGEMKDDWEDKKTSFDGTTLDCDGRTEIDEINEILGTDIPNEGYETIAGFVISQMDKIPRPSEETRWKNIRIVILRSSKRSVIRVRLIIEKDEINEQIEVGDTEG
jgi:putative hemolysin